MDRRLTVATLVTLLVSISTGGLQAADDPLGRARLLYNQGQFEAAVNAAELARSMPSKKADQVAE